MKSELVGLSVGARVPPQLQCAEELSSETTALQPGTPFIPGTFVGAAVVEMGFMVSDGNFV